MLNRICVYCASSSRSNKKYLDAAYQLGQIFAQKGITTVYGGGSIGLMGALARGVLENNGKITGIIPKFMMELEWGNPNVTNMIVVNSMAERKKLLTDKVDAVVALPGGTGTLEELAETLSLKKLGLFMQPIVILNTNGFYDTLIAFLERMIADSFIRAEHRQLFSVANHPDEVIAAIASAPNWGNEALDLAAY
jgi:hypothetical protein